jgi:hypothetical protein
MGIAEDKPRQLAPTVGTTGSGSMGSPAPSPTTSKIDIDTTSKIDIDTIISIAAPTGVDTTSKIDIDTIIGIAAPTSVNTTAKINIDTIAGIAVPAIVNANLAKPEVDVVDSIVIDNVSPSTAKSTPAANAIDPLQARQGQCPETTTWPSDYSTSMWTAMGRWNYSPLANRF